MIRTVLKFTKVLLYAIIILWIYIIFKNLPIVLNTNTETPDVKQPIKVYLTHLNDISPKNTPSDIQEEYLSYSTK